MDSHIELKKRLRELVEQKLEEKLSMIEEDVPKTPAKKTPAKPQLTQSSDWRQHAAAERDVYKKALAHDKARKEKGSKVKPGSLLRHVKLGSKAERARWERRKSTTGDCGHSTSYGDRSPEEHWT